MTAKQWEDAYCLKVEYIDKLRKEHEKLRQKVEAGQNAKQELEVQNAALKIERNRLRVVLQDIADASGFDNIGNWARNKAKDALRKEEQP